MSRLNVAGVSRWRRRVSEEQGIHVCSSRKALVVSQTQQPNRANRPRTLLATCKPHKYYYASLLLTSTGKHAKRFSKLNLICTLKLLHFIRCIIRMFRTFISFCNTHRIPRDYLTPKISFIRETMIFKARNFYSNQNHSP